MTSPPGVPLCVMLIDDSEADRKLFREILKAIDASIDYIFFSNAPAALAYLSQPDAKKPDYIFLDVNMPGMDGIECLARLKKINDVAHIPVYMYSTGHPKSYAETAMLLGAAGCYEKTINFEASIPQLSSLLKGAGINRTG